jgi:NhaP-type Na+/H+ or K+/H+ antiporter
LRTEANKNGAVSSLEHNPALLVELGAAFVLVAALVSRVLLSRLGIPPIVTLLAFGLMSGPGGFGLIHLGTNPAMRALLQLAVVVVLFESTLRMDLRGIATSRVAIMAITGVALILLVVPHVTRAYHFSELIGSMAAAICIVTGPTVIGPLMARLRPRTQVSHLLESEGLVLDALGVIIAAAVFATYTSRPGTPLDAAWHVAQRVGAGLAVGLVWGFSGRFILSLTARSSSDISKMSVLFLGFAAYASAELLAHESGLVAVVACGLLLDFRTLPHERLLRAFKEDLAMLALSTVFVLLASQIQVSRLGPLLAPAAAITGVLIAVRVCSVAVAMLRGPFTIAERVLMTSVFPRGIVAISLATYYATQIPAWGLHGGNRLAGIMFLIVVFTIAVSTPLSMALTSYLRLQMPSIVIAGVTPVTLDTARQYKAKGYLPLMVDANEHAVALARSHDFEAQTTDDRAEVIEIIRRHRAKVLIADAPEDWRLPHVKVVTPEQARTSVDH